MVYTRKWKNQQKRQFIQLNDILNDFVIGSDANVFVVGKDALEHQADRYYNNPERSFDGEISACQNQIIGKNLDNKIGKRVRNAVRTVKNRMHGSFSTATVTSRVELAVRSITGSSGHGTSSAVQNSDRRNSIGNTENAFYREHRKRSAQIGLHAVRSKQ